MHCTKKFKGKKETIMISKKLIVKNDKGKNGNGNLPTFVFLGDSLQFEFFRTCFGVVN